MKYKLIAAAMMLAVPSVAIAESIAVRPIQVGLQSLRYQRGISTVSMSTDSGTIEITPLPLDHGGLAFEIAVFNAGGAPAIIDISNIDVSTDAEKLRLLSAAELIKKAKSRAMWAQIGIALATGLAAGVEANQRDYYRGSYSTPRGTYRWTYSAPSTSGQIAAAATTAAGGYAIVRVQEQLDRTRAGIGENALQTTTVDPGESYAAKFVLTRMKIKKWPQTLRMMVRWNGKEYPFAFDMGPFTRPVPVFAPIPQPAVVEPVPSATPAMAQPAATTKDALNVNQKN